MLAFVVFTLLPSLIVADENGGLNFPTWTYYAEIVEHSAIAIVAVLAIFMHVPFYKTFKGKINLLNYAVIGWVILVASQIVVIFQHFLIYLFGIFTAIVDHGLLLISVVVLLYAYIKLLKAKH